MSFETDIKPLFREQDRTAMLGRFDLWKYEDVKKHSFAIVAAVSAGTMPCDGRWAPEHVATLQQWVDAGTPP
jgi:hypothetical protein